MLPRLVRHSAQSLQSLSHSAVQVVLRLIILGVLHGHVDVLGFALLPIIVVWPGGARSRLLLKTKSIQVLKLWAKHDHAIQGCPSGSVYDIVSFWDGVFCTTHSSHHR